MEHDDYVIMVTKMVEIIVDPSRSRPAAAANSSSQLSVEERNAIRKQAGDDIVACVQHLVDTIHIAESSELMHECYEKYVDPSIDNEKAAK